MDDGHHAGHGHASQQCACKKHVARCAEQQQQADDQQREQQQLARRQQENIGHSAAQTQADQAAANHEQGHRPRTGRQYPGGFQQRGRQGQPTEGERHGGKLCEDNRVFQQVLQYCREVFQTASIAARRICQDEKQRNQQHVFHQHVHGEIAARRIAYDHRQQRIADEAGIGKRHGKAAQRRQPRIAAAQSAKQPADKESRQCRRRIACQVDRIEYFVYRFGGNGKKH